MAPPLAHKSVTVHRRVAVWYVVVGNRQLNFNDILLGVRFRGVRSRTVAVLGGDAHDLLAMPWAIMSCMHVWCGELPSEALCV